MNWLKLDRRSLLRGLAVLPGMGVLMPSSASAAARLGGGRRNVIRELGVRTFINAAGTYTSLTASLIPRPAWDAMTVASTTFCPLQELHDAVGKRIAELTKSEAALVSAGAASALAIGTAGVVAGTDRDKIRQLPDTRGMKNEVIVQKSHRNGYDHAVRNAGIRMIEVETAAELESAIHSRTAMMFFLYAANNRGQIGYEEFAKLGKKHNVPTMIDAAADLPPVENLWKFTQAGFDLAIFSGGKGIKGPQSAGLLLGRKDLIEAGRMNSSPNSDSLGRISKVNKEEMVGMLVALEMFINRDHKAVWKDWENRCNRIASYTRGVKGIKTEIKVPELSNGVPHLHVNWDHEAVGKTPKDVAKELREGNPGIEVRPRAEGELVVAVWMLEPGEDRIVGRRLSQVLKS
ncbi:MAG: selenocysteine synthase [Bryobacterales bacterium]|nr:selenocysteine synthase [Bryobacterales bacterium]MDE0295994.1 selenocysteine synthase [Bryobacterales bacterium]MDE0435944.1 selenocysteine synthase [Bryobacterales bacterium]